MKKKLELRVLTQDEFAKWQTNGFVILNQAIPAENISKLKKLIFEFEEKVPSDPITWHRPERRPHPRKELNNSGMVELYNHQYLWDNRMEKRVYDLFVDLWDREDL